MTTNIINTTTLKIIQEYLKDLNVGLYGRQISKNTGLNLRMVQEALKLLESEKMLYSEKAGRTKLYKLNKNNPDLKNILIAAEIDKYNTFIKKDFEIKEIIHNLIKHVKGILLLHGSYIKGYANKESDLDILVIGTLPEKEIDNIKRLSSKKLHIITMPKSTFTKLLKNNDPFIIETIKNHVIAKGFEAYYNMILGK